MSKRKISWILWGLDQVWWQIRAAWFGIAFLLVIIGTALIWSPDWVVARTDALFVAGLLLIGLVFALGVNRWEDALPMGLVFLLGIGLELQKTRLGAWDYAESGVFMLGAKPLFVGFMYAAVASYVIRSLRLKELTAVLLPHWSVALGFSAVIYGAFFVNLPIWFRPILLVVAVFAFQRARVIAPSGSWLPVPVALGLAALLLWVAENIGTFTGTWTYRGQSHGELVTSSKIGAWFLLLNVVFWVVTYTTRNVSWRGNLKR